ncbi:3-isopropylmalate dehydratase small subunit [Actinomycetes bacterium M1A6_2h]
MEPIVEHTGVAVPIPVSDIDTDQIIPTRFCVGITKVGYEDYLLYEWRKDPAFVLNQPAYSDASILVVGKNFGCGSSREMAVWALKNYGIKVVISPEFGDIFRGNALKNGLLTVTLPEDEIGTIVAALEAAPGSEMTVDLERQTVRLGNLHHFDFQYDDDARWRLLEGMDDIAITLRSDAAIKDYESRRSPDFPTAVRQ